MDDNPQLYIFELAYSDFMNRDSVYLLVRDSSSCTSHPVMRASSILAVSQLERVPELLSCAAPEFQSIGPVPSEIQLSLSAADVIKLVKDSDDDPERDVVNFINSYLDLASAIGQTLPQRYRKALWDLADHMTFSSNIGEFFAGGKSRTTYVNALMWLHGAVDIRIDIL